ncbi:MAG: NRAMP family metal ion transporter [Gammaproteobacteria bacterium GWE2_37_16]|nr:MAG: NRAMP family metal ion transporter [Gammaproteobacteria bacterium GWE2_37_16]
MQKKSREKCSFRSKLLFFLAVLGPGMVVMLADTDVGSIVVAAQSGVVWGYKLLPILFLLIPVLYVAQELTVRLGIVTGKGHGELILKHFGKFWAWVSVSTLVLCCAGAIITEMSGIASVGILFGVPIWFSMLLTMMFLFWLVWTKSYHSVERVALAVGLFELIYILVAWQAHPSFDEISYGLANLPWRNPNYLYLAAANIGAVVMPWMIFYQQSAIVDKGLKIKHLQAARLETLIGAFVTQIIMVAVLIATATTIGKVSHSASLETVQQISESLTPFLGVSFGKILFSLGMLGAALIATIVVSLTAAWGLGEITGFKHSLQDHPKEAPWFYGIYGLIVVFGAGIVVSGVHLVSLNIAVEVMNALCLPIVLGFLFLLARYALPEQYKIKGWYAVLVGAVLLITSLFGFGAGILGMVFGV